MKKRASVRSIGEVTPKVRPLESAQVLFRAISPCPCSMFAQAASASGIPGW